MLSTPMSMYAITAIQNNAVEKATYFSSCYFLHSFLDSSVLPVIFDSLFSAFLDSSILNFICCIVWACLRTVISSLSCCNLKSNVERSQYASKEGADL